jgi:hypothetical protein
MNFFHHFPELLEQIPRIMRSIYHCTEASKQLKPAFAAMHAMRKPEDPSHSSEKTAPAPGAYAQSHGQEIDRRQGGAGGPNLPSPDIHPLPQAKTQKNGSDEGHQMGSMDPPDKPFLHAFDLRPLDAILPVEGYLLLVTHGSLLPFDQPVRSTISRNCLNRYLESCGPGEASGWY